MFHNRNINGRKPGMTAEAAAFSVNGSIAKVFILGLISLGSLFIGFQYPVRPYMIGGGLVAFFIYFITGLRPALAPYLAPFYALVKGYFLGSVSARFAGQFDGILIQAFALTMTALLAMVLVYATGMVKVSQRFRMIVTSAVASIMVLYLFNLLVRFAGFQLPFLHEASPVGIIINVVILVFACLNLLVNFSNFEKAEQRRFPRFMEWYYAMAFLFTIVWMYVEFMRLISKWRRLNA